MLWKHLLRQWVHPWRWQSSGHSKHADTRKSGRSASSHTNDDLSLAMYPTLCRESVHSTMAFEERRAVDVGRRSPEDFRRTETCRIYKRLLTVLCPNCTSSTGSWRIQKGLGIALVQKGIHVAFGSNTLAECQSRYSNIEREMLAMVHGIQRYHTYLYGRPFKVIADHIPLLTICEKHYTQRRHVFVVCYWRYKTTTWRSNIDQEKKLFSQTRSVVCLTQSTMTTLIWTWE